MLYYLQFSNFWGCFEVNKICLQYTILKRHGDAQPHDLAYIDFFYDFHIFYLSYEKVHFEITVFKRKQINF